MAIHRGVIFARRSLRAGNGGELCETVRVLPVNVSLKKKKKRPCTYDHQLLFLSYERSNTRMSFSCVIVSKARLFFNKIGHPRAPSKIRSFIRSVRFYPINFRTVRVLGDIVQWESYFWEVP